MEWSDKMGARRPGSLPAPGRAGRVYLFQGHAIPRVVYVAGEHFTEAGGWPCSAYRLEGAAAPFPSRWSLISFPWFSARERLARAFGYFIFFGLYPSLKFLDVFRRKKILRFDASLPQYLTYTLVVLHVFAGYGLFPLQVCFLYVVISYFGSRIFGGDGQRREEIGQWA